MSEIEVLQGIHTTLKVFMSVVSFGVGFYTAIKLWENRR